MARIISGSKTAEDLVRAHLEQLQGRDPTASSGSERTPRIVTPPGNTSSQPQGDYFSLDNITCVDIDGKTFENYPTLAIRRDIFRDSLNQINFTPYNGAVYCQQNGLFLPSVALTCNIIAALYHLAVKKGTDGSYTVLNPEAKRILDQYKDKGNGTGWHTQNTVINYNSQRVIHYPHDADFPQQGGTNNINSLQSRRELPFKKVEGIWPMKKTLKNMTLEEGLNHPLVTTFVKQFTGMADPSILVKIGQYFQKPARVWFPTNPVKVEDCTDTRAAWFGCYGTYLYLDASYYLYSANAARGVRGGGSP